MVREGVGERFVNLGQHPSPDAVVQHAASLRVGGKPAEALALVEHALHIYPNHAMLHHVRAGFLMELQRFEEALEPAQHATTLQPGDAGFHVLVGMICGSLGKLPEATAAFRAALAIDPSTAEALEGLVEALRAQNDTAGADAAYSAYFAAHKRPSPVAITAAADFLLSTGRGPQAARTLRSGITLYPGEPRILSVLPGTLNYVDVVAAADVIRLQAESGRRFASVLNLPRMPLRNTKSPDRRLKLAYMSPDFRGHSVSYFLKPLLECHDRNAFEIYGYATFIPGNGRDATTARLQDKCDHFHESSDLAGHALAEKIAADGIDVLVDLAGWTGGGRPVTMLKKPAPVLVTYLGYPSILGFPTLDARIVDVWTDPVATDGLDTLGEPLVRLSRPLWCYRPPADAPAVSALPMLQNGYVTFGSFNAMKKVSPTTLKLWAGVLAAVPDSRLMIKAFGLGDTFVVNQYQQQLARLGVDAARVTFCRAETDVPTHLSRYAEVDIALDTWPYNGTTTTCEALWMGVPVVSLSGRGHWSRVGLSLLSAIGLQELVCETPEQFASIAGGLAADSNRLAELRGTLRARLAQSPLMDARSMCGALERVYRELWTAWCTGAGR